MDSPAHRRLPVPAVPSGFRTGSNRPGRDARLGTVMPVTSGVRLSGQRRTAAAAAGQSDIDPGPRKADDAVQVIWGSFTDRGRVRRVNEDALLAAPPAFVVSDGMGGHAAGDVAAAIVIEEFGATIDSGSRVGSEWVLRCIHRAGGRIRAGAGGGATVVGAAIVEQDGESYWLAFNIGDSRIYRWSGGELTQISVDHSYVQELVEDGRLQREQMRRHPQRNVITRAVGLVGDGDPDCWLIPAREGERLLLCTDGVTGELADVEVADVLASHIDPQLAAEALVTAALAAGGRDNATAVVIDVLTVSGNASDEATVRHPEPGTGDDLDRTWRPGKGGQT